MKKSIFWVLILMCKGITAQTFSNENYEEILQCILYSDYSKANSKIKNLNESVEKKALFWQVNTLINGLVDTAEVSINKNQSPLSKTLQHIQNSKIRHDLYDKNDSLIVKNYNDAYLTAKSSNNNLLFRYVLYNFIEYLYDTNEDPLLIEPYLKELKLYSANNQDIAFHKYYESILESETTEKDNTEKLKSALKLLEGNENNLLRAKILHMIGLFASYFQDDEQTAIDYWLQASLYYEKVVGISGDSNVFTINNNIANSFSGLGNISKAFEFYYKAKPKMPNNKFLLESYFYQGLAKTHKLANNIDSTFFYLQAEKKSLQEYYDQNINNQIRSLLVKNQTAEKEKQILIEKQQKEKNQNIALSLGALLLFGGLIFYLVQNNTAKQRKLAEQKTQLEKQKVETLLKEQELVSIDAMIAGQEKERQKVANELHDDLGSLMATVKLHFDNVKVDQKDPALKNAQKLLDKAYQKIRGMAHAKNSGVMANQGLLPAVKKMAKTINETNALEVTVEEFGLAERMENSLELTIFRMLQELLANIIKHAEANKANIQFTQHDDKLNIIVEDDGKGFDMSAVKRASNGMGLGTIEKRIEHLEGTFTVDSVLGKGTSILIDIPI